MEGIKAELAEAGGGIAVSSPPAAAMPAREETDARARLHELARELVRGRNRALMWEYLRLRRAVR